MNTKAEREQQKTNEGLITHCLGLIAGAYNFKLDKFHLWSYRATIEDYDPVIVFDAALILCREAGIERQFMPKAGEIQATVEYCCRYPLSPLKREELTIKLMESVEAINHKTIPAPSFHRRELQNSQRAQKRLQPPPQHPDAR